jgi:hypothetical protein
MIRSKSDFWVELRGLVFLYKRQADVEPLYLIQH